MPLADLNCVNTSVLSTIRAAFPEGCAPLASLCCVRATILCSPRETWPTGGECDSFCCAVPDGDSVVSSTKQSYVSLHESRRRPTGLPWGELQLSTGDALHLRFCVCCMKTCCLRCPWRAGRRRSPVSLWFCCLRLRCGAGLRSCDLLRRCVGLHIVNAGDRFGIVNLQDCQRDTSSACCVEISYS